MTSPKSLPTMEDAIAMPRHMSELNNQQLYLLAESIGHAGACRERMRREIMVVDGVSYVQTTDKVLEMYESIRGNQDFLKAPYVLSIYAALVTGWASLPLVFHYPSAALFNDNFVTAAPPEVGDADTWLEVGSWSWSWMEPPLGTISFFLLCMQFAREQRMSIGGKAMTEKMQDYQAEKLTAAFPQYDETIVRQFAASIALVDSTEDVKLEHTFIEAFLKQGK